VSRVGYFFEDVNILSSTFCVCADGFQGLLKAFHFPLLFLTFLISFASVKLLINFENGY
jgi:Na+/H+-dicarboxylate symporter